MAEKKQNPAVVVILIIIIIGAVLFNIKRMRPRGPSLPSVPYVAPSPAEPARQLAPSRIREAAMPSEKKVTMPSIKAELKRLTSGPSYDTQPAFSPNGREIAYVLARKEGQNIYTLKLNSGEEPKKMTEGDFIDSHPSWAPDSAKIIFSSNRNGGNGLFWLDKLIGEITPLNKEGTSPALSYDGEWLSFVDQYNIWIMRLATKEFTPLTRSGYNAWPSWDKEGKKIYFSRSGLIKAFDLQSSEVISVTFSGFCDYVSVSPLDSKLAYVSLDSGRYDLWMMNPDGSGKEQLTGDDAREYFPSWSPDGKSIVFASTASGPSNLWLLHLP